MLENDIKNSDSVKKNLSYQFIYQVLILIVPLIIAPYLTRTLGDTAIGIYSYSYSIGQIFVVIANLGIAKYGQRLIAEKKEDSEKLRKSYWSLFVVHAIVSIVVFIIYILFSIFIVKEDKIIFLLQGFYVLSAFFDITWLFYGIEQFKNVVIKNTFVKIIEFILIFTFVKDSSDLYIYTIIMSFSVMLGMAVMLPYSFKLVKPIKINFEDCKKHMKPLLILFIASVATLLFTFFDKTLLGIFSTKENVAYYEYSNKIVLVPRTIATVISSVMYSRACIFINENKFEQAKKYREYSFMFVYCISFASIFGLLGIGNEFVKLYYGESFEKCNEIIKAMSPTILIISMADILRTQILIPIHKDKEYTIITIVSAILNIIVSLILLPYFDVYGVIIGSILSEGASLILINKICSKYNNTFDMLKMMIPFCIFGIIMYSFILILNSIMKYSILNFILKIIIAGIIYLVFTSIYLLKFFKYKNEIKIIVKDILRKARINA